MVSGEGRLGLSISDMNFNSEESGDDEGRFLSDPDDARTPSHYSILIDSFYSQLVASSSRDFLFVTGRIYQNKRRRMVPSRFSPS